MTSWLKSLVRGFLKYVAPHYGSTYGYVVAGENVCGAYRLDRDGDEGEIYYYSQFAPSLIEKRHYRGSIFKGIENYSTEDYTPSYALRAGARQKGIVLHLQKGDELAKAKFNAIERQFFLRNR